MVTKDFSLAKAAGMVTVEYQKESIEDLIERVMARLELIEEKLQI